MGVIQVPFPTSKEVPNSPYGKRKAKEHAQAEADRTGKRTYMQLDIGRGVGRLTAICTHGPPLLLGAPFYTFYPKDTDD